jgi:serine/threonine protein kinase
MVRPDGYVKLLDFGLARAQPEPYGAGSTVAGSSRTEAGLILGTIGYMAPEQARGEAVSAEADVFSLGVVLYELVTGRHPFMAASQLGTLNALQWETPEPPSLLNPELPRALDQLILESLQKDHLVEHGRAAEAATSCSPSCRGSPKAATRWTLYMRKDCSRRWSKTQGSGLRQDLRVSARAFHDG